MRLISDVPAALYKYLPRAYVADFVNKGIIRFSNLTSFRQIEHRARGDVREGCHVDSPNHDVALTLQSGYQIMGPFSMRTDVKTDKIFVFCMSRSYAEDQYVNFDSDACIVVTDPLEFIRRCNAALKRLLFLDPIGCIAGNVEYYAFHEAAPLSIDKPWNIPFLKAAAFAEQEEFRLCFGKKGAFTPRKRLIINQVWETEPDHLVGIPQCKFLQIGSVLDITEVRLAQEAKRGAVS